MLIQRLSPILTIITNEYGETFDIRYEEDSRPIHDKDIKEIIDDKWTFWDVKATFQLINYDK
jgi:hypothetical protein